MKPPLRFWLCLIPLVVFSTFSHAHGGAANAGKIAEHPQAAKAAIGGFDNANALKISQAAIDKPVGDYVLRDRQGRSVRLSDYRGKPLIVSLIYTSCVHVCPLITQTLSKAVQVAQDGLGADSFAVVSIGFDVARDTPAAMAQFARAQGVDKVPQWEFLSADADTIWRLSRDLGFIYSASSNDFDHLTQTTLIDPSGKVYQQVYGESFGIPQLTEPLKRLVTGVQSEAPGLAGLANQIRLFCTVYDPASNQYRRDYSFFIVSGINAIVMVLMTIWLIRLWIRAPRRNIPRG